MNLEYIKSENGVGKFLKERIINWKIAQNWIKKHANKNIMVITLINW